VNADLQPLRGTARGLQTTVGSTQPWDDEVDVVIVGFGAAGASTAIEARRQALSVLVVDRFSGGGSSQLSAGVVYLGGGTPLQKDSGWDDTPQDMYDYLKMEVGDAVSDGTLEAFCDQSVSNFWFLRSFGVPFTSSGKAEKTSYPPDDCTLYFSGNELCEPYASAARPAPRGHRALGKGLTGHLIFAALRRAATELGVEVFPHTKAERLVVDEGGRVIGVVLAELSRVPGVRSIQNMARFLVSYGGGFSRSANRVFQRRVLHPVETLVARRRLIRARGGIVLAAGGFVFNGELMRRYAPDYAHTSMRLGTAGDDGHGIFMGHAAGGAIGSMDRCCAWRFINPPSAWVCGVLVGPDGTRVCNEELYGSTIGEKLAQDHGGRGVLVIDADMMDAARKQLRTEPMGGFQWVFGLLNNYVNHHRAQTLHLLAKRCGIDADAFVQSVRTYNKGARAGVDVLGKRPNHLRPVVQPPFYAIDCDQDTLKFPTPTITLGGLVVDGRSARVKRDDGAIIGGLYAVGRNAVGVSSKSYVSGLSVADGIFSGRNAGRSIGTARKKEF
jgi:3-oxo-5alpha-steroid 4-dehydrogenase